MSASTAATSEDRGVRATKTTASRRGSRDPLRRSPIQRVITWAVIVVLSAFGLLPVYWLLVSALTPSRKLFAYPPSLLPHELTLDNFRQLGDSPQLLHYLVNSLVVASITAVLSIVVASYMAFAFSKYRFHGRRSLMAFVLASQLFPQSVLLVTLYAVFSWFHLLNTYAVLVLSFTTFTLPLCVWMLKGFFDSIDDTLIEAARLDRASRLRILHSIVLPISAPGLVAAGLFAFIRGWNDFIFALTLTSPDRQTLPPGLVNTFLGEASQDWAPMMAASLLTSAPVVIAFMFLQRHLVSGLSSGAVKG